MKNKKKPNKGHEKPTKSEILIIKDYQELGKISAEDLENLFDSSSIEAHLNMLAVDPIADPYTKILIL